MARLESNKAVRCNLFGYDVFKILKLLLQKWDMIIIWSVKLHGSAVGLDGCIWKY